MKRLLIALCPLIFALPAESAFVYSGLQNIVIPTGPNDLYIDIDNGTTSSTIMPGSVLSAFFGGSWLMNLATFQPARTGTHYEDAIVSLATGTLISDSLNFSTGIGASGSPNIHMGPAANQFFPGSEAYLGFKFTKNNSAGPYFGWMRVVFTSDTPGGLIKDWMFDDSGVPIIVGAPEPHRAILVLFGLMVFLKRRR